MLHIKKTHQQQSIWKLGVKTCFFLRMSTGLKVRLVSGATGCSFRGQAPQYVVGGVLCKWGGMGFHLCLKGWIVLSVFHNLFNNFFPLEFTEWRGRKWLNYDGNVGWRTLGCKTVVWSSWAFNINFKHHNYFCAVEIHVLHNISTDPKLMSFKIWKKTLLFIF